MTNAILRGKPDAGNPHVRFDEGEVASAKPRRGSLLYKNTAFLASIFAAVAAFGGVLDNAWIKGTTDKDPITYKPGEKMTFTLAVQRLGGELPAGEYLSFA